MKLKRTPEEILKPLFIKARNGSFITPLIAQAISERVMEEPKPVLKEKDIIRTLKEWEDEARTLREHCVEHREQIKALTEENEILREEIEILREEG